MAIGYRPLIRRLGHRPWFAALGRRMVPVDRWLERRTRGRLTILGRNVFPQLLLTTIGRRTGAARTTPLLYAEVGSDWVIAASNWGQEHHPAWSTNLIANPDAYIEVGGALVPVTAWLTGGVERLELWVVLRQVWPAYDVYAERSGREIRVFRLTRR